VVRYDMLTGHGRLHQLLSYLPLSAALRAYALLFEITRIT
jgi:hypothetical protein